MKFIQCLPPPPNIWELYGELKASFKEGREMDKRFPFHGEDEEKNSWSNLLKGSKLRLVLVVFSLLFLVTVLIATILWAVYFLSINFLSIMKVRLGSFLLSNLFRTFLASGVLSGILGTLIIFFFQSYRRRPDVDRWLCLSVYLMVFVIIFGFFALNSYVANPRIQLNLFDGNLSGKGTIDCGGTRGPAIVGDIIICKTSFKNKSLIEDSTEIVFTLNHGESSFSEKITSEGPKAPENVTYLELIVYAEGPSGEIKKLTVGYQYTFLTEKEFEEGRERFLNLFIALIFAAFVTVPIMVLNLKRLWKNWK